MYQGKFLTENKTAAKAEKEKSAAVLTAEDIMDEELAAQAAEELAPEEDVQEAVARKQKPKKKKGITVGTIIFYLLYFMLIGAAAFGIKYGLGILSDWLKVYEASQPDTRSQEIFDEIFANPDWGKIYDMAGLEGTTFESKDAYVTYMQEKVGSSELTYVKTSAGLSGGQKYIVKLGEEKVATFTMQNPVKNELEIPEWTLSEVTAGFFTRNLDVTVLVRAGRTVTLNGIPLDDGYIVKTTSTTVDEYLPEGITGPQTATLYAKGFLVAPEVMVIDKDGSVVELEYDAATNTYTEKELYGAAVEISDAEYDAVLNATYAYCRHMIGAPGMNLSRHFDTSSAIYKTITKNELWFKGYSSYDFSEETITEYHRYSDTLFSARIQITLNTYRKDGSLKDFPINTTLFLEKDSKGQWKVTNMTNVELHDVHTQVRLTWMQDDAVLASEMVDASENRLTAPAVTVPEGKEFLGWFIETTDEEGNVTLSLVFAPSEDGTITLADSYVLEPMVLIARFDTPKGA